MLHGAELLPKAVNEVPNHNLSIMSRLVGKINNRNIYLF